MPVLPLMQKKKLIPCPRRQAPVAGRTVSPRELPDLSPSRSPGSVRSDEAAPSKNRSASAAEGPCRDVCCLSPACRPMRSLRPHARFHYCPWSATISGDFLLGFCCFFFNGNFSRISAVTYFSSLLIYTSAFQVK